MLKVGRKLQPDVIVVIGDFMDCYAVSDHIKDPTLRLEFKHEVRDANVGLNQLDALGATTKVFIAGNHEDRLDRYLKVNAPELAGMISVRELLKLDERGWDFVPYKDHRRIGKVYFTHDVGASGRNAVFRVLDTYDHSVVSGHAHRLAYVVEGNALGEKRVSAMFGWLGDSEQCDYMNKAKARKHWALGFGVGYMEKNGVIHFQPIPIVLNKVVFNGEVIS